MASKGYAIAARFTPDSVSKVSKTGYVAVEIDREEKRLYFVPENKEEGYKLTASSSGSAKTVITFNVDDIKEWQRYVGEYNLCKDVSSNDYYIDLN